VASSRGSSSTRTGEARIRRTLDDNDDPVLAYRPVKGGDWKPLPKSIAGRQLYGTVWEQDNNVPVRIRRRRDGSRAGVSHRPGCRNAHQARRPIGPSRRTAGSSKDATAHPSPFTTTTTSPAENHQAGSEYAKLYTGILKAFPGQMVYFTDFSRDNNRVLFSVASDKNAGDWYIYDRAERRRRSSSSTARG
jgi:hypothetical protein